MKRIKFLLLAAILLVSCNKLKDCFPKPHQSKQANVKVPGTSDPWLAGMPNGTISINPTRPSDTAPHQSPVLVPIALSPYNWVEVANVTGKVSNGVGWPIAGPDGGDITSHDNGDQFGKSNTAAPFNSLLGVFLDENVPTNPAPDELTFFNLKERDYLEIQPKLKQVFFIGNGKTSDSTQQRIVIPNGATRLFLGTMDACCWADNTGYFKMVVTAGNN